MVIGEEALSLPLSLSFLVINKREREPLLSLSFSFSIINKFCLHERK